MSDALSPQQRQEVVTIVDERIAQKMQETPEQMENRLRKEFEVQADLREMRKTCRVVEESTKTVLHQLGLMSGRLEEISRERNKSQTHVDASHHTSLGGVAGNNPQISIANGRQMADENQEKGSTNIDFGGVSGDNAKIATAGDIFDGDKVAGDKTTSQGATTINGDGAVVDVKNENTIAGNVTQTREALQNVAAELSAVADPLPVDVAPADAYSIPEYQDHPEAVFSMVNSYADSDAEVSEEDQQTLTSRFGSMMEKYGSMAMEGLKVAAPIAIKCIGATASPVFPLNVISAGLEGFLETTK